MVFIKFLRIIVGAIVVWLLYRLLVPRDAGARTASSHRRAQPRRGRSKFVESSVVDKEEPPDEGTGQ